VDNIISDNQKEDDRNQHQSGIIFNKKSWFHRNQFALQQSTQISFQQPETKVGQQTANQDGPNHQRPKKYPGESEQNTQNNPAEKLHHSQLVGLGFSHP
jgi:hypothetical protein